MLVQIVRASQDKSKIKVNGRSGKACGADRCAISEAAFFPENNAPDLTKGSRSGSPGLSLSTWRSALVAGPTH